MQSRRSSLCVLLIKSVRLGCLGSVSVRCITALCVCVCVYTAGMVLDVTDSFRIVSSKELFSVKTGRYSHAPTMEVIAHRPPDCLVNLGASSRQLETLQRRIAELEGGREGLDSKVPRRLSACRGADVSTVVTYLCVCVCVCVACVRVRAVAPMAAAVDEG